MPINIACECGREYVIPDKRVGVPFRCYTCGCELCVGHANEPESAQHSATPPPAHPVSPTGVKVVGSETTPSTIGVLPVDPPYVR